MDEKKNPRFPIWTTWIIAATMIIQLLSAAEYYHMWRTLHDSFELQKTVLQYQVECLEVVTQSFEMVQ